MDEEKEEKEKNEKKQEVIAQKLTHTRESHTEGRKARMMQHAKSCFQSSLPS